MYQTMINKEIREVQVVFWVCFCLSLVAVFSSVVYDQKFFSENGLLVSRYDPGAVYGDGFQTDYARVALLAAILVGLKQTIPEEIRKTWPLLIHFGKQRRRVLVTKLIVGGACLVIAVGVPLALLMFVTAVFPVVSYPVAQVFSLPAWSSLLWSLLAYLICFLTVVRTGGILSFRYLPAISFSIFWGMGLLSPFNSDLFWILNKPMLFCGIVLLAIDYEFHRREFQT